ncbi:Der1-like family protein [Gregarina niphandrodes]|uniref:Derlin n=1 Tax=Gregarina niphandrodes TaxID=110365 RepID=A0A023AYR0_GRENI|nr:Der1-like family protein [Gregarina niphandrodes]EZG43806.1 Der1-like family protein [Gregarina niphandrodes]|eukprot:XP_011133016.1 Der1-like family protein [Gregarina niphandrodes]
MEQFVQDTVRNVPPITRCLLIVSTGLMILTSLELVSPYSLYFDPQAIYGKKEVWRLVTSVLYFGSLGIQFLWTSYIVLLYCGKLESENYEGDKLKFGWRLLLIVLGVWTCGTLFPYSLFLSSMFLSTLMYVWSRKNPDVIMNVLLFNVQAPWLSWVMLGFQYLVGRGVFDHLVGILLGHLVYFLDDIYPTMPASSGKKPLDPPLWVRAFFTRET